MPTDLSNRIQFFLEEPPLARSHQTGPGLAVGSLRGPVRDDNEDRAVVAYIHPANGRSLLVALVCDGLGGMIEGGAAATIAASSFISFIAETTRNYSPPQILPAIRFANKSVFERFKGSGGATLTALIVDETGAAWAGHVGDSRLYAADNNKNIFEREEFLTLLTQDDTIGGIAARGIDRNEDQLDNRLLQFVGIGSAIEPHIISIDNALDMRFLITSDGAHGLGRKILEGVSRNSHSSTDWVRKLTFIADAAAVDDNASAVAISVREISPPIRFHTGLGLTLWSPTGTLELWISSNESEPKADPKTYPTDAETTKQKRLLRAKSDKKSPRKYKRADKDDLKRPQLKIQFGPKNSD